MKYNKDKIHPQYQALSSTFKTCSVCKTQWKEENDFFQDPDIVYIGYQADFREHHFGLLMFNHETCGNTLSFKLNRFKDLLDKQKVKKKVGFF